MQKLPGPTDAPRMCKVLHNVSNTLSLITETPETQPQLTRVIATGALLQIVSTRNGILFVGRIFQGTYVFTDTFIGAV